MERLKSLFQKNKFTTFVYPVFIIIAIPTLLIINTLWNLNSFNRDANFIIRHLATSLADTIKPQITQNISDPTALGNILINTQKNNADIIAATVIEKDASKFNVLATSSNSNNLTELSDETLADFALSTGNSYAGLSYDPFLRKNVWKVAVAINNESKNTVLSLVLSTDTVSEILGRTSRDSLFVLTITLVITIALLINHLIFYKRSLRAQQLEEIDRLKDEFISMASHELRAPVTGLVGYLELLKDKLKGKLSKDVEEDFSTLGLLTDNLQKLINDLLEVSRIEQGRIKITKSQIDVKLILENILKEFTPLANNKGLELKLFTPQHMPLVSTDAERFIQIITNLLSNSIKYTLKGKIDILAIVKDNNIEISVKDTGIGIPASEMEKLFSKFMRVKDEKTSDVRGTGLGLWITKQLAQALGGNIEVQSIYGTGSTFTLIIPVSSV